MISGKKKGYIYVHTLFLGVFYRGNSNCAFWKLQAQVQGALVPFSSPAADVLCTGCPRALQHRQLHKQDSSHGPHCLTKPKTPSGEHLPNFHSEALDLNSSQTITCILRQSKWILSCWMIPFSCSKLIYRCQTSPVTELLKILRKQPSKEGTVNRTLQDHSPSSLQSAATIF